MRGMRRILITWEDGIEYIGFAIFMAALAICICIAFLFIKLADISEWILKSVRLWRAASQCPSCGRFTFEWERAPFRN